MSPAGHHMADGSAVSGLIISGDMISFHIGKHRLKHRPVLVNSDRAVTIVYDRVRPSRIKSGSQFSVPVHADRELGLIPVTVRLIHPNNRKHFQS